MNIFYYVARIKNYSNRTVGYVGILNTILLALTFKKVYNIQIPAWIIVVFAVLSLLIIGFLDFKYVIKYEWQHLNAQNDIKKDLEELKRRLP